MFPHALLMFAQESLPPPPQPTGSPEIDTARVFGIVVLALGIIVLLALAIRPLVVRPGGSDRSADEDSFPPRSPLTGPQVSPDRADSAIIPFPRAFLGEGAGDQDWSASNMTIAERFDRVVGDSGSRRKLGDRRATGPAHDLATAAMHRIATEPGSISPSRGRRTPVFPIVPLHGQTGRTRAGAGSPSTNANPERVMTDHQRQATFGAAPSQDTRLSSDSTQEHVQVSTSSTDVPAPERVEALAMEPTVEYQVRWTDDQVDLAQAVDTPVPGPAIEPDTDSGRAEPARLDSDVEHAAENDRTTNGPTDLAGVPEVSAGAPVETIDTRTRALLHQVVRDLLYCANSGDLLQGFALHSDAFLQRFVEESGLSEGEFRQAYGLVKARPRDQWDHLDGLFDITNRENGSIEATASYVDGKGLPSNGLERYRFVEFDGVWMIDDIVPLAMPSN